MLAAQSDPHETLRALLVLGRVSNLPTVWSNCLAGWVLGGGGSAARFLWLCAGASCLYIGGMYLNDAFDEEFDRQYRKERPIPSGRIAAAKVWMGGALWLILGTLFLAVLGATTLWLGLLLVCLIVLYDAVHKAITLSPLLMAACRLFLYLIACSAAAQGVTGLAMWSGLALGAYIVGLSYLARKESARGPLRYWPCLLLGVPVLLALIVNNGPYLKSALVFSAILTAWVIRCLCHTFGSGDRNVGRTVAGLLAGIVLVDLLAVADASGGILLIFAGLFAAALLFQRFIPAT